MIFLTVKIPRPLCGEELQFCSKGGILGGGTGLSLPYRKQQNVNIDEGARFQCVIIISVGTLDTQDRSSYVPRKKGNSYHLDCLTLILLTMIRPVKIGV